MRTKWFTTVSLALITALAFSLFALPGAAPAAAQACGVVHTTDIDTWYLYVGTQGHYEMVDGGVHIWTESNTGEDVVEASTDLVVPFSTITSASLDYTPNSGATPPGIFIWLDTDVDGNWDGAILYEPIYGGNWWLANMSLQHMKDNAPHTGGGNGSPWFGTLAEWIAAFPNAQTLWIGFTLGSGVQGDGVVHSMAFGCHIYTFGLPGAPLPEAALPPMAGFTCRVMVDAPMTGPLYAEKLLGQEWSVWNGFVVQDLDKHGGNEISLHHHEGEYSHAAYYRIIGQNGGEVRYFAQTDLPGICAEVSDPLA
ncbi:MAG: hypothetical protein JNL34_06205 [Anaerolineae bacterium]|nr:hypothetical protein [Anaerolineae bacterium]